MTTFSHAEFVWDFHDDDDEGRAHEAVTVLQQRGTLVAEYTTVAGFRPLTRWAHRWPTEADAEDHFGRMRAAAEHLGHREREPEWTHTNFIDIVKAK